MSEESPKQVAGKLPEWVSEELPEWVSEELPEWWPNVTGFSSKRMDEAQYETHELPQITHNTLLDAVISTDINYNIVSCNKAVQNIFGYTPDELVGKNYSILVSQEMFEDPKQQTRQEELLKTGYLMTDDYYFKRKNGEIFPARFSVAVTKDELGNPTGLVGSVNDITERKQAEEALKKSEQRFSRLAQTATDAIITINDEGHILFFNHTAEQIFSYTSTEILDCHVTLLMPDEYKASHNAGFSRYLNTGKPTILGKTVELTGRRKDGSLFPLEISLSEVSSGKEKMFISIIRNITERKQIEEEREKLIIQLQEAFDKIDTMSGLIPICAWCKKVRDDQGYWNEVEAYVEAHSKAEFSHGICPNCAKKHLNPK
ncbi:MAG: PAS domain S-box protein [Candidatus Marinimicrobia bacterium]|nr:PAS domain S-box protein [Candidatus Neomarinimicrobiota bacterium]